MRRTLAIALVAATLGSACGDATRRRTAEPRLRPELRLAGDSGDVTFAWIGAIAVADDGTMYTLHPSEARVRIWSAAGRPEGVLGGSGEEAAAGATGAAPAADTAAALRAPDDLGWVGDTLWVADPPAGVFRLYTRDGRFLRTLRPRLPGGAASLRPVTLLPDGSLLASSSWPASAEVDGSVREQLVLRLSPAGEVRDTLAVLPVRPTILAVHDPGRPDSVALYTYQPFPDAPLFQASPGDSTLVVVERAVPDGPRRTAGEAAGGAGAPDSVAVRVVKLRLADGDTVFARELRYAAAPVDSAAVAAFVRTWAARALRAGGAVRPRSLEQAEAWVRAGLRVPAARPAVTALGTGRDGSVWLLRGGNGAGVVARVLDPAGRETERLRLPPGLRLLAADTARIWATFSDSADVPWLVRYRIEADGS